LKSSSFSRRKLSVLKLVETVVTGEFKLDEIFNESEYASVIQHTVGIKRYMRKEKVF
jgi:hypothetical protein